MLKATNHEINPMTTHGFLLGVEIEDGTNLEAIRAKLIDSITYVEGVGQVDAEHLGPIGDYKSLEDEVLDTLMTLDEPTVES